MAYLILLYHIMARNSAPMHFACLPLSTTLFMWQAHQNTQEPMGNSKGRSAWSKLPISPYPALLAYQSTPLQNGFSPSELLMGLRLRDQNREGQILGATKQPRSYLVKTEMSTLRRNRSALVPTSSQPAFPTDGPTMVPQDKTLPVNHTPPRVSTPVSENQPAEPTTPTTCRSTTAVSTQGGPPQPSVWHAQDE